MLPRFSFFVVVVSEILLVAESCTMHICVCVFETRLLYNYRRFFELVSRGKQVKSGWVVHLAT
jgi:hypothetical protein